MDNDKDLEDIKFLILDLYDSQKETNRYLKKINSFINFIILIYVLRFIIIGILIYIMYKSGINIINGIM